MSEPLLSLNSLQLGFHFLKTERLGLFLLSALSIIAGLTPTIESVLLQKLVDSLSINTYSIITVKNFVSSSIFFWVIIYAIWWEGWNWFWRAYDYIYVWAIPRLKGRILDELYDLTQYHSQKFFQTSLAGHITNQITESARSFEMIISILIEKILRKSAMVIFAVATFFSVHSSLGWIFIIWMVIFFGFTLGLSGIINQKSVRYAMTRSVFAGKLVDVIANISSVRMFSRYDYERNYLKKYIDLSVDADISMQWFMLKLRYVLGLSCSIMVVIVMYHLFKLRHEGSISIGDMVLAITLIVAVVSDIYDFYQEIGDLFEQIGIFNQSIDLIEAHSITDDSIAKELMLTNGQIEFRNVTFQYGENPESLFCNKSIIIRRQEKVGLVGASGSGKSTFVNLICRLYEVNSGQILIDGQDIKSVTQNSLRRHISFIPQEPILFHRSIYENISYGKSEANLDEVISAAKLAHADEFIRQLPEAYKTICGERGGSLSGGQRQRIAISRAILENAAILILDEATSALDSITEGYIQESLNFLMQNKTVLVVAHRLSTLLNMDRILVFDKGKIVEDGPHIELLKKKKLYYKLWNAQVNGLLPDNL